MIAVWSPWPNYFFPLVIFKIFTTVTDIAGLQAGARLKANERRSLFPGIACMVPSREALATRASTTLDIARQILGTLAARNCADEVLKQPYLIIAS